MPDPTPDPPPSTTSTSRAPAAETATRFAVYDLRYEKFVGKVSDKRPSKADTRKLAGHDDVEVREV